MAETHWDMQEIKHLKKKELLQFNLIMLLLFVLIGYLSEQAKPSLLYGVFCVLLWLIVASALYNLITGRHIGTDTSRRVQEFDRYRLGERIWKRNKMIEVVIVGIISLIFTVLLSVNYFSDLRLDFPINTLPFVGVWIAHNIGEVIRMKKL